MKLTVGGEVLDINELGDNEKSNADSAYGFGKTDEGYRFMLKYYRDSFEFGGNEYRECLKWEINEPVKISAPVQLTYTVKLTNPQKADGTYGQYDKDGSKEYADLYTNNQAVLYPVNSKNEQGLAEYFNKPTVSYTVSAAKGDDVPKTGNLTAIYMYACIFLLTLSALGGTMLRCTKKQRG